MPPIKWLIIVAAFDPDPVNETNVSIGRRIGLGLLAAGFAVAAFGVLVIGIWD